MAGSLQESNPGHLWLELPVLCSTELWQLDNHQPEDRGALGLTPDGCQVFTFL